MKLLFLFILIPMIEIALFIQVGGVIGLGWTLAIVLLTALAGSWMVRTQGALALGQLRSAFQEMRDPSEPLAHGAMILFSGALLLTPGFFTDACGILLLIPRVRSAVFRYAKKHITVSSFTTQSGASHDPRRGHGGDVIAGDFEEIDSAKRPTHRPPAGPSGWTQH